MCNELGMGAEGKRKAGWEKTGELSLLASAGSQNCRSMRTLCRETQASVNTKFSVTKTRQVKAQDLRHQPGNVQVAWGCRGAQDTWA